MKTGLFIFRRDLRLEDNNALNALADLVDVIIPIFIFDPFQIEKNNTNSNYISYKAIEFMIESLTDLEMELRENYRSKLQYYLGNPSQVLKTILNKYKNIKYVAFNGDFSAYSFVRDGELIDVCKHSHVECIVNNTDLTLHKVDAVLANDGKPVKVFGFYHKRAVGIAVEQPFTDESSLKFVDSGKNYSTQHSFTGKLNKFVVGKEQIDDAQQEGGRSNALEILDTISGSNSKFNQYNSKRDILSYLTTQLSPHLKFGTVSIREVYYSFKQLKSGGSDLQKQLYWRTWFFVLSYYRNKDTTGLNTVPKKYQHLEQRFANVSWISGAELEKRGKLLWQDAKTGFPVIDASIRQLNTLGWMHNRGRLLVANFSVKILHINPFGGKWSGQESFSRQLMDGCHANNYGNWMWIVGVYDSSGYRYGRKNTFGGRIFKNIIDFKKFDPKLEFVRKWLPELRDVPDNDIYNWNTAHKKYNGRVNYPSPIVDFDKQVDKWYIMTSK